MARTAAAADLPGEGPVVARLDAVILAGGLGRRMHPLTQDLPKPLLPVGLHTLLEHQVASLAEVGVERVVLATSYRAADFTEVVRSLRTKGIDLTTVVEETARGTGGGLRGAMQALPGAGTVVVLNGDLLTGHDLRTQVDTLQFAPSEVLVCVHVREVPDARAYGCVLTDDRGRVTDFVEKSPDPPSRIVNAGTYVVRHQLAAEIPEGIVSLERQVFPALAARGALLAHREDAYFLDVGTPAALVQANRDLVLGAGPSWLVRTGPEARALIAPGALVDPSASIVGGSVVHTGARVARGARVDGAVVLTDAKIGPDAVVSRSVIGREARVGSGARVVDTAIGTGRLAR